jgi:HEAT repeat protein
LLAKSRIIQLLEEGNYAELIGASKGGRGIFRALISLSYDKESLLCWRAIEAMGLVAGQLAKDNAAETRSLVQRLLWMMRDESGNNVGSAPEILGEIVRNSPEEFSDIAPIIASFHDEAGLRRGVFRALQRIAEVRPDLCRSSSSEVGEYIKSDDAYVRAFAILLARTLGLTECVPSIEEFLDDESIVRLYGEGEWHLRSVSEIAKEAVTMLQEGEK